MNTHNKTQIFNYFDKVVCLNLKKRTDRKSKFTSQVNNLNLGNFDFFESVDGSLLDLNNYNPNLLSGEIGIMLTNLEVIKKAKKDNLNNILIIEDDCVFDVNLINNFDSLYNSVPENWDMLYFGGNHNYNFGIKINDNVIKVRNTFAIHCVAIKSHLFDEIIDLISTFRTQIDVLYCELQKKYNVYCFYPAMAKQDVDFSNIQNKIVDYNHMIQ